MRTDDRLIVISAVALLTLNFQAIAGQRATPSVPQVTRSIASDSNRLAEMQHHFADIMMVHEAVSRGDLPAVREVAVKLFTMATPAGMPDRAAPFMANIRKAAQRAGDATTIEAAAEAAIGMVTECAGCHRAVGTFPSASRPFVNEVGGVVGHMKDHQRAADHMLIGLMVPSQSEWLEGASRLRVAALLPSEFPKDPKLTREIRRLDIRVHEIADQAIDADTSEQRARAYATLLGTCAQCHNLHAKVWGPGRGGGDR